MKSSIPMLLLVLLPVTSESPKELSCFSCCSLDDQPYRSRYGGDLQLTPETVCGPHFVDLSVRSSAVNRIMFEKLITCSETDSEPGSIRKLESVFCIKIVGYVKESRSNITARGCAFSSWIPDREHSDSRHIKFGKWSIRGTIHFCDSVGCNSAYSSLSIALPFFMSAATAIVTVLQVKCASV